MATKQDWQTFSYAVWEQTAETWTARSAEIEDVAAPAREWVIRELDSEPGDTVLELAAGAGDTGFEVARIIGSEGRLISTDFQPSMVDAARRRGAELALDNVDYRVMDAERIELDDDSVDGVLCRYGYMLMADPAAALSETRRVLRPDGRLALSVWGPPERNPFFSITAMSLVQQGHIEPPDPEGPGIFAMASEERTRELLEGAGFTEIRTEEVPVRFAFRDVDELFDFTADTAGPIALALRSLSEQERSEVRAGLADAFAPFATDNGLELPGVTLVAVAR